MYRIPNNDSNKSLSLHVAHLVDEWAFTSFDKNNQIFADDWLFKSFTAFDVIFVDTGSRYQIACEAFFG